MAVKPVIINWFHGSQARYQILVPWQSSPLPPWSLRNQSTGPELTRLSLRSQSTEIVHRINLCSWWWPLKLAFPAYSILPAVPATTNTPPTLVVYASVATAFPCALQATGSASSRGSTSKYPPPRDLTTQKHGHVAILEIHLVQYSPFI